MDTNRLVKAIIIVAAIIIFIALLWICYDKFFVKDSNDIDDVVVIDETKKDNSSPKGEIAEGEVGLNNSTVVELSKIFTTSSDKNTSYLRYRNINKLSSSFGTNEKLYFTLYALNLDKDYQDVNCSEVKVNAPSGWLCGENNSKTTKAFSENSVNEKYKYLFGHEQSIDKQNCDYEYLKIVYDKDLGKWIVFYPNSVGGTGDVAKTTIDGAYSDQGNLDIVTSEIVNNKTNTVTLTFRFDEEENHYVFVKRLVE